MISHANTSESAQATTKATTKLIVITIYLLKFFII